MIVPLKTPTNTPTTTSKQGIQPMKTDNKTQQQTLSNAELSQRIDDLINLNRLAGNSLSLDAIDPAADYALNESDRKLAALYDYFVQADIKAEVRDTPPPVMDLVTLTDTGNDAHQSQCAACVHYYG